MPAGGCEHHQPPLEGARRELREEAGLEAEHWLQVLDLIPSGSLTDEREIVFLAWRLTACERDPDPQEIIRTARVPFETVLQRVMRGEIRDAGTVAIVFAVDTLLRRGELPDEVARSLSRDGAR
ncbi:NUDIX domain-containing protein [Microvirga massiliensis]|uniref:NUDIX domain-containing protein n=1 Tax=Microvirga massiliensis TaxID=1033741 RepID=UPI0006616322|nr:NUDIX hydrolase [Microvirga massiliensis]